MGLNVAYVHVPTNTVSAFAPVKSDIKIAKAMTNTKTMIDVAFRVRSVRYSKNMGTIKMVTATQTARSLAARAIRAFEKKKTSLSCVP